MIRISTVSKAPVTTVRFETGGNSYTISFGTLQVVLTLLALRRARHDLTTPAIKTLRAGATSMSLKHAKDICDALGGLLHAERPEKPVDTTGFTDYAFSWLLKHARTEVAEIALKIADAAIDSYVALDDPAAAIDTIHKAFKDHHLPVWPSKSTPPPETMLPFTKQIVKQTVAVTITTDDGDLPLRFEVVGEGYSKAEVVKDALSRLPV